MAAGRVARAPARDVPRGAPAWARPGPPAPRASRRGRPRPPATLSAPDEPEPRTAKRACGECAACCFFPAIESLAKPAFQLCQHSARSGCGIYSSRPQECRDYECLWLSNDIGEPTDRPDQLGIVFDRPTLVARHPDYAGVDFICAREIHEGARHGARAAELIRRLARVMVVRLTRMGGGSQLTGPDHLIRLLVLRAEARSRE